MVAGKGVATEHWLRFSFVSRGVRGEGGHTQFGSTRVVQGSVLVGLERPKQLEHEAWVRDRCLPQQDWFFFVQFLKTDLLAVYGWAKLLNEN